MLEVLNLAALAAVMKELFVFVVMATSIFMATEELKEFHISKFEWKRICPKLLAFWGAYAYGGGLMFAVGIDIDPHSLLFYFDVFTTSLIISRGAGSVYRWKKSLTSTTSKK